MSFTIIKIYFPLSAQQIKSKVSLELNVLINFYG